MSYTVALDAFYGPLDLLLYLVKRNEVDVLDIPIARLAEQFLDHLRGLSELDVEFAGEFLVMAATLMEIKSRMLLPTDAVVAEEERADPRSELVKQLLEYRKFKDAAAALEARAEERETRVSRLDLTELGGTSEAKVKPVELWDLVSAFARLMRETQSIQPTTIAVDDTPQHVYEAQISGRVRAEGRIRFRDAFTPPYHKARLIGIFLAILELIRNHGLGLEQAEEGGEIWLVAPAESESNDMDSVSPPASPEGIQPG
jgi:segregation and condensation protein A